MNMNAAVFNLINGIAHKSEVLDKVMIWLTSYGPLIYMAVLAAFYLYGVYRKDKIFREIAVNTLAVTGISLFFGFIIGIFYYEPRPFVTNKVNLLMPHAPDTSFPSDHSLGTMSIALGINNCYKVYGTILIMLSLLVGLSRVYAGAHYPLDVVGSYLIVFVVNYLYKRLLSDKINGFYFKAEKYFFKSIFNCNI